MTGFLPALGLVSALGYGKAATCANLYTGDAGGMLLENGWLRESPARVGRARIERLPEIPAGFERHASRNNRLLLAAFAEIEPEARAAIANFGPARVGIVLGTSTSGIAEGEAAIAQLVDQGQLPGQFHYAQQELGDPARFLARYLGISGPAYVVSTACTSSAKALASARNLLETGICDAVIAGGVDTLSRLTINGFTALESTTALLCNPMSANRQGINIGEAAALFLVSKSPAPIALLGVGESSDAHHISAPDPEGKGAELAMRQALADARVDADRVCYVNLHGTATPKNDEMEGRAVARVFGGEVPCSSTKPMTGHALGAAGAIELAFCWLTLSHHNSLQRLPPHLWDGQQDPALPVLNLVRTGDTLDMTRGRIMLSNSFAFGGNNCCLAIGDAQA